MTLIRTSNPIKLAFGDINSGGVHGKSVHTPTVKPQSAINTPYSDISSHLSKQYDTLQLPQNQGIGGVQSIGQQGGGGQQAVPDLTPARRGGGGGGLMAGIMGLGLPLLMQHLPSLMGGLGGAKPGAAPPPAPKGPINPAPGTPGAAAPAAPPPVQKPPAPQPAALPPPQSQPGLARQIVDGYVAEPYMGAKDMLHPTSGLTSAVTLPSTLMDPGVDPVTKGIEGLQSYNFGKTLYNAKDKFRSAVGWTGAKSSLAPAATQATTTAAAPAASLISRVPGVTAASNYVKSLPGAATVGKGLNMAGKGLGVAGKVLGKVPGVMAAVDGATSVVAAPYQVMTGEKTLDEALSYSPEEKTRMLQDSYLGQVMETGRPGNFYRNVGATVGGLVSPETYRGLASQLTGSGKSLPGRTPDAPLSPNDTLTQSQNRWSEHAQTPGNEGLYYRDPAASNRYMPTKQWLQQATGNPLSPKVKETYQRYGIPDGWTPSQ